MKITEYIDWMKKNTTHEYYEDTNLHQNDRGC